jgi:hypothetical protein
VGLGCVPLSRLVQRISRLDTAGLALAGPGLLQGFDREALKQLVHPLWSLIE